MVAEIIVEHVEGVATITLAAPARRNALTLSMARELTAACEQIDADASVGAVVVRDLAGGDA